MEVNVTRKQIVNPIDKITLTLTEAEFRMVRIAVGQLPWDRLAIHKMCPKKCSADALYSFYDSLKNMDDKLD